MSSPRIKGDKICGRNIGNLFHTSTLKYVGGLIHASWGYTYCKKAVYSWYMPSLHHKKTFIPKFVCSSHILPNFAKKCDKLQIFVLYFWNSITRYFSYNYMFQLKRKNANRHFYVVSLQCQKNVLSENSVSPPTHYFDVTFPEYHLS